MRTLSLYKTKTILKTIDTNTYRKCIKVYCWIYHYEHFFFLVVFDWIKQVKNNTYTSCLKNREPSVDTVFLNQLQAHVNSVLSAIINRMSLSFPNEPFLCLYIIYQHWTHKASFLLANKWELNLLQNKMLMKNDMLFVSLWIIVLN